MKTWLRLTVVAMTVGGGFAGTLQAIFAASGQKPLNLLMMVVFLGLYGYVTASGLLFVHDARRTGPVVGALGIQIPWISSSILVYEFGAGVSAFVGVGSPEKEGNFGFHLYFDAFWGSRWQFSLFQDDPWRVGANLIAVVIFTLVLRAHLNNQRLTITATASQEQTSAIQVP